MTKGVSEGFSTTHESDLCNHHHGGGGRWKSPTFAWRIGSPELMRWGQSEIPNRGLGHREVLLWHRAALSVELRTDPTLRYFIVQGKAESCARVKDQPAQKGE
jgi:hypothetical protein